MTRLLVLGLTAISLLVPTTAGAQKITPVTVKIEPGGQVTVPFQGPELNLVTGTVVTVGDGTPVRDVVARIIRPLPTSLSIIVFAVPTARPRPDYQVWLQTSASKTPIHAVTVQVVPKAPVKGAQSPPPAQSTPPPAQSTPPPAQSTPPPQTTPPPALTLVSFSVAPAQIGGGGVVNATITLSTLAPSGGIQVSLASDKPNLASVPPTRVVPAGQSSVGFQINTAVVAANTAVTLSATLGTMTRTAVLTVGLPRLKSIISTYRDQLHDLWNVMVQIDAPAPAGGAVVALTSQNTAVARVPATLTIPHGQNVGFAPIDFTRGPAVVVVTLTGTYGGVTQTGTVGVLPLPPPPVITSVNPTSATPNGPFTVCGTDLSPFIKLGQRQFTAGSSGTGCSGGQVRMSFNVPADMTPGSYTMSMETAGGIFTNPQPFIVLAPGQQAPPPGAQPGSLDLVSITLDPAQVGGGGAVTATITLSTLAPAGGTQVSLASDKPAVASVLPTRLVPAGQSSVGFQINTAVVAADTAVTLSATLGTTTRTAALTVGLPRLKSLTSTYRDQVHDLWNVMVQIDAPAPAGGAVVNLTSQNTAVARVPTTLIVPQGQTLGFAAIDFTRGPAVVVVTLTGDFGGVTKTGVVGVLPLPPPPVITSVSTMSAAPNGAFTVCGTDLSPFIKLGERQFTAGSSGTGCASGQVRMSFNVPGNMVPGSYTMSMETAGGTFINPQPFIVTAP